MGPQITWWGRPAAALQAFLRRRGLAFYLMVVFIALSLGLTWAVAAALTQATSLHMRGVVGGHLAGLAARTTERLDNRMGERVRDVQLLAMHCFGLGLLSREHQRHAVEALKQSYPHYDWVGITDRHGRIIAATGGQSEGDDASQRPWFRDALGQVHLGKVQGARNPASAIAEQGAASPRFLDIAFPYTDAGGALAGVVGVHLSWDWVTAIQRKVGASQAREHQLKTLIVNAAGKVLAGPPEFQGKAIALDAAMAPGGAPNGFFFSRLPDGHEYLAGYSRGQGYFAPTELGWSVLVLQAQDDAFAPIGRMHRSALVAGLSFAIVFALAGLLAAWAIAHPLRQLARSASSVEGGEADQISLPAAGYHEIMALKDTLNGFVKRILAGKQQLRDMAAHQERIKEEERTRIAREIHDELGSQLTGIKFYLSYMADLSQRAGLPGGPHLAETIRLADDALETVGRVIAELRPSVLDELGLWEGIEWQARRTAQQAGLAASVLISPALAKVRLEGEAATAVFRIVQEALTNVVRHAEATAITVTACRSGALLQVEVIDDGKGIGAAAVYRDDAWGTAGMRERARYFGGELTIEGRDGCGTRVKLSMPIGGANEHQ